MQDDYMMRIDKIAKYVARAGKRVAIDDLTHWIENKDKRARDCPFGNHGNPSYQKSKEDHRYPTCPCLLLWPHLRKVTFYDKYYERDDINDFCPCCTSKSNCKECDIKLYKEEDQLTTRQIEKGAKELLSALKRLKD